MCVLNSHAQMHEVIIEMSNWDRHQCFLCRHHSVQVHGEHVPDSRRPWECPVSDYLLPRDKLIRWHPSQAVLTDLFLEMQPFPLPPSLIFNDWWSTNPWGGEGWWLPVWSAQNKEAKCPPPCFSLLYAFSSRTFIEEVVSNGFPSRNGKQHGCNYASLRCQFVNNRQSDSVCLQRVSVTSPSFKIYLFLSLMLKMKNMWK